jgi:hypothetical protein
MSVLLAAAPFAVPLSASAQTARDVANLVWGSDRPAIAVTGEPRIGEVAGGGSAADLARLTWSEGAPAVHGRAPDRGVFVASGGTARDLARLSAAAGAVTPMLEAAVPQGAMQAGRPHS